MNPWWLLIIVPASVFMGIAIMACCAAAGRADLASELMYKDVQIKTLRARIVLMADERR